MDMRNFKKQTKALEDCLYKAAKLDDEEFLNKTDCLIKGGH